MLRSLAFALLVLLVACSGSKKQDNTCASDADCTAPGTRCDTAKGQCICKTSEACDDGFFCNKGGVCQALAGCLSNADCKRENTYCDISSGMCLSGPAEMLASACGLASHCPYGTICVDGTCVEGCFDDGDCMLGQICINGQCFTGNGICKTDTFCDYGERCDLATSPGSCKQDRRGPYCRGCSSLRTPQNPEPCDRPRNFCLVNNQESAGFPTFCGVDCSLNQSCPNGYECDDIIILTQNVCQTTAECRCDPGAIYFATSTCTVAAACDQANGCRVEAYPACNHGGADGPAACIVPRGRSDGSCECATNDDCANGGACVAGLCCSGMVKPAGDCVAGEGQVSGFCTCATDADCPRDTCDSTRGACAITGLPCTPGANDCGTIPCQRGGCFIGRNCAPVEGLSCSIVGSR